MMYCGRCGTELVNHAVFCSECGEKVITAESITPAAKPHKKKLALFIGIPVSVVLIAVLIIALVIPSDNNSGYRITLNNYCKAFENNDPELMYNSVCAQYWINHTESTPGTFQAIINEKLDSWECGGNFDMSYEVRNERYATEEEFEEVMELLVHWYSGGFTGGEKFSVTEACVVDVTFTVEGAGNTETYNREFLMLKEDDGWRITRGYIDCDFYDNTYSIGW